MSSHSDDHSALISQILESKFGLHGCSFQKIGKAKNNSVYQINLPHPLSEPVKGLDISSKPCTSPIPAGTSNLIIRISNKDVSLESSVRVRNEVASLTLARDALCSVCPSAIPLVFGWEDITSSPGWILEEQMKGEELSPDDLAGLDQDNQQLILRQMAKVIKCLQDFQLPSSITGYGGLTFNNEGKITSTLMTVPCGGPFPTYALLCKAMCMWQLDASDRSSHLGGWKENGMRERLDQFFSNGLDQVLTTVSEDRPTLIHGDFSLPNLLFDTSTYRLTAVLDFDFTHIGAPISEWLFSFWDIDGLLPGSADPMGPLRNWLLNGFPQGGLISSNDRNVPETLEPQFTIAAAWDKALAEAGVKKPSTISGADTTADIWWFSQELCQAYWFMESFLARKTPEQLSKMKESSEKSLDAYLVQWGF
ncbi:aminoglycoside phosphotransferase [Lipomyces mesembrius]